MALHAQGKDEEAAEQLRRTLELRPDLAPAHNVLGLILREAGQCDEALDHFRRAVELDPALVPALNNLSQALLQRGHAAEALPHCDEAVRLQPDLAAAHYTRGNALEALDRLLDARGAYLEALWLDPDMAVAHAQLGRTLLGELRPGEALPWLKQALDLDSQNSTFHEWLGTLYMEWEQPAMAIPCFEQALSLACHDRPSLRLSLGQVLIDEGRLAQAEEHFRVAQRLAPQAAEVQLQLGNLHEVRGEMPEAEAAFRAAMSVRPDAAMPIARLATHLRSRLPEEDLAALQQRLGDPGLDKRPRARLLFAMAHVLDGRGEYNGAAECASEANALALRLARGWRAHDPAAGSEFVDGLVAATDDEFLRRLARAGPDTRRPVFVFGLPRSGTTVIEQVLSSHSSVHGADELPLAQRSFESIPGVLGSPGTPLGCVPDLDRDAVDRLAEQHLAWLSELECGPAERVVDKMPGNYMHLGLLATLFPRATFIQCRRDLRDVAVSCWMTDFRMIPWANDPDHIAAHFACYLRIMDHWRSVLPVPIHEVDYEDAVADLEGVARRLIATCGLEWEAQCLEFYKSPRPVRTASVTQVRQPIYSRSVGRWRNYEQTLAKLFAKLPADDAAAPIAHAHKDEAEPVLALA